MGFIGSIIVGLIVGALAKLIMPGRDPGGFIVTILIGLAGSLIAGWVGSHVFGWYADGSAPGWIASILGAVFLLWLYRMVVARRA